MPRSVAVVYQVLSHYREPVFRLLCQQGGDCPCYTFFSDTVHPVRSIDPEKAKLPVDRGGLRWKFVKNICLPGHLLWQRGLVRLALSREHDTIIYSGDVHFLSTWISCALARLAGKRTLMWTHGFWRHDRGLKGWIRNRFYQLADGMLLYGKRARQIMEARGFSRDSLYVVYNSLDYERQVKLRSGLSVSSLQELRRKLFQNPDWPVLLFTGRLIPQKRLHILLEAAAILKAQSTPVNVLLVGDGEMADELRDRSVSLELAEAVHFHGPCYEEQRIAPLIALSDVCVSPGEVGLTCMHALVYGVPVVTHDDPGYQGPEHEAIIPGRTGDFFKRGDARSLAAVVRQWLTGHPDRQQVAAACHEVIDQFYNPPYQVKIINAAVLGAPATQIQD